MAYTMKTEGLDEVSDQLNKLGEKAGAAAARGLYEGAGTMANAINKGAESIRTAPFHYAVFITREPTPEEKEVVLSAGAGIAKFDKNGSEVNTSVGYAKAGYAELNGKQVPIALIANSINSGTSFMHKQPFFRQAVSAATKQAEAKIIKEIEENFNEIIK